MRTSIGQLTTSRSRAHSGLPGRRSGRIVHFAHLGSQRSAVRAANAASSRGHCRQFPRPLPPVPTDIAACSHGHCRLFPRPCRLFPQPLPPVPAAMPPDVRWGFAPPGGGVLFWGYAPCSGVFQTIPITKAKRGGAPIKGPASGGAEPHRSSGGIAAQKKEGMERLPGGVLT